MVPAASFGVGHWAWAHGNISSDAPARAVLKACPEFRFPEPRPSGGANQQEGPGPREARSQSRPTQESNADPVGAFLDLLGGRAARSAGCSKAPRSQSNLIEVSRGCDLILAHYSPSSCFSVTSNM